MNTQDCPEPLAIDKDPDYIAPDRENTELIAILQDLQKRFVPHTDFHNQVTKAIKLAQP